MSRFICWFAMTLVLVSGVWGQQTTPPQLQPRPAGPANPPGGTDREIRLDVQVTDHSGAPVRGLQRHDFTLLDDKQPRDILAFREVNGEAASTEDSPSEIILVVDAVNTAFRNVAYERDAIRNFLLRNNGQLSHPASLAVFTSAGTRIQNGSSRDGKALADFYAQYETGLRSTTRSQGFYGATERFAMSLNLLKSLAEHEEKQPGRKLMIWLSPGWPLLANPSIDLSSKGERHLFDTIVALSSELRHARITLYAIDPIGVENAGSLQDYYYQEFLKGIKSPRQAIPPDLSLQVIAVQSGGRVLNQSNDVAGEIAHCAADADDFYTLSFNAPPADQANEYHALTIKVDKPEATARTHTGYYAQP